MLLLGIWVTYLSSWLQIHFIRRLALHELFIKAWLFQLRLLYLRSLCSCWLVLLLHWQVSKLIILLLLCRSTYILRERSILLGWWLLSFDLFIRIFVIHLDCQTAHGIFSFICCGYNHRSDVIHPLVPVTIDKLSHVVRLRVWVLKIQVCWLGCALVWVPILGDPPRFSADIHVL